MDRYAQLLHPTASGTPLVKPKRQKALVKSLVALIIGTNLLGLISLLIAH